MGSLLKSTLNTRALPVGGMRYIRSDAPLSLTEKEIQWLLDNDISTLIDLRSAEELKRTPCPYRIWPDLLIIIFLWLVVEIHQSQGNIFIWFTVE